MGLHGPQFPVWVVGLRDWGAHVCSRGASAPLWSCLAGVPTWCFQGKPDTFFFLNCNVSGSIKNKVCVHVSCNTLTLELTAKGEDFSGFQHYCCMPGHCGISILLLWHFLIKNRTLFLVELIGFIFVSCKFCWEKVKSFTFLKLVFLFLIPVQIVCKYKHSRNNICILLIFHYFGGVSVHQVYFEGKTRFKKEI